MRQDETVNISARSHFIFTATPEGVDFFIT